jgi:CheY-like chemotaxis protein
VTATVPSEAFVLVVEDDADVRQALLDLLATEGFSARGAGDGREALRFLGDAQRLPDVIILDLLMPGMDGAQFRERQMKDPRLAKIPVLVLTGDGDYVEKMPSIRAGAYIKKPIRAEPLIRLIKESLAGRARV